MLWLLSEYQANYSYKIRRIKVRFLTLNFTKLSIIDMVLQSVLIVSWSLFHRIFFTLCTMILCEKQQMILPGLSHTKSHICKPLPSDSMFNHHSSSWVPCVMWASIPEMPVHSDCSGKFRVTLVPNTAV